MSSLRLIVSISLFAFVVVNAQNSATTKPSSYFTVDANAEQTSTQNWWGDNVDSGAEPTTAAPPSGITSSGVSPAVGAGQLTTGASIQAAGVLSGGAESATMSGVSDSTPTVAADDGNSTKSFAPHPSATASFGILMWMTYVAFN